MIIIIIFIFIVAIVLLWTNLLIEITFFLAFALVLFLFVCFASSSLGRRLRPSYAVNGILQYFASFFKWYLHNLLWITNLTGIFCCWLKSRRNVVFYAVEWNVFYEWVCDILVFFSFFSLIFPANSIRWRHANFYSSVGYNCKWIKWLNLKFTISIVNILSGVTI